MNNAEEASTGRACIVCGSDRIQKFLDLGKTALANKFLAQKDLAAEEPVYPLCVGFCHGCGHVQLTETVPPQEMFSDYLYVSSASDTLRAHLDGLSATVISKCGLRPQDLAVDIGCNDGTLLEGFQKRGMRVLGVDPARNLAELKSASGIERYIGFFTSVTAEEIADRWGRASAVTATNTFPHIPALMDFLKGIDTLLAPGGTFVVEAHYLGDVLGQLAFDTVYHEHVSYWALGPMMTAFRRAGFVVVDVEHLDIHHGQLRVFVKRQGEGIPQPTVERMLDWERQQRIPEFGTYEQFARSVESLRTEIREVFSELRAKKKRVAGYGAPAKANTLLSYVGLGPGEVEYIADRSPLKQGRYTPGTRIPVVAPEKILEDQPDYLVILAWNFAEEIMRQQAEYRRRGGNFVLPVPEVRVV